MTACSVLGYNIPWTYSGVSDFSGGGDEPTYAEMDEAAHPPSRNRFLTRSLSKAAQA